MTRSNLSNIHLGLFAALASVLLIACTDRPTAPKRTIAPNQSSSAAASVESGTGIVSVDVVLFWECAGEDVHNVFDVNYKYTLVELPNGRTTYREIWLNTVGAGTITGLTSGTVWRRDIQASPYVLHTGGLGGSEGFVGKVRFVSETGPDIDVRERFRLVVNANGELTVDDYSITCTAK